MPPYFQLEPIGLGTARAESMSSYVCRLAESHGVSRYQFISHLRDWYAQFHGGRIPIHCQSARLNGYNKDAAAFCTALGVALQRPTLSGMTLLGLSALCAKNGIGSLRHVRAWCPACFGEDQSAGRPIHDRLVWQIQAFRRCNVHAIELFEACPYCKVVQTDRYAETRLDICHHCRSLLYGNPKSWRRSARPGFGETDLLDLVQYLSSNPDVCFDRDILRDYFRCLERKIDKKAFWEHVGDVLHTRDVPSCPQLHSLLAVADFFQTRLIDILTNPQGHGQQLPLDLKTLFRVKGRSRVLSRPDRRQLVLESANRIIRSKGPYPTKLEFCLMHSISVGCAEHQFSTQLRLLASKRRKFQEAALAATLKRVKLWMGKETPQNRDFSQVERMRWVAKTANAPLHVVRNVFRTACQARTM